MCPHRRVSTVIFVATISVGAGACGTLHDTMAQQLAAERWKQCESPTRPSARLQEIRPDGQIWWTAYEGDTAALKECLQKAAEEQATRRLTATPATAPPVAEVHGAAVTAPSAESWDVPVWKRGDEWAFRWESPRGKGTFVWSVDRIEVVEGTEYYVVKSGTQRESYSRKADLGWFMDKVSGEVEVRRVGAPSWYPWPLTPGRKIEYVTTEERPKDRQTNEIRLTCEVDEPANVVVPAGEFRAVRIACTSQRTGKLTYEGWYAPRAKHWVRERSVFDYGARERELIKYRVE
jgi:hypothetical protein